MIARAYWWLTRYRLTFALMLGTLALSMAVYTNSRRSADNRQAIIRSCEILGQLVAKSVGAQGASQPLVDGIVTLMVKDGQLDRVAEYRRNASKLGPLFPPDCEAAADDPNYKVP